MIRSELVSAIARENPGLRAEEVEKIVSTFFDEIGQKLASGGRVELRAGDRLRVGSPGVECELVRQVDDDGAA